MSESQTTLAARQAAESLQELELRLGCARIELKTRLETWPVPAILLRRGRISAVPSWE